MLSNCARVQVNHAILCTAVAPTAAVFQVSAVSNGQLYCIGGHTGFQGSILTNVQIYQP